MSNSTAVVTGASSGIGAVYARRLAARGHDLLLVARRADRLEALAAELRQSHGITVDLLAADLTAEADLARVEDTLRQRADIGLLVNNAGMGPATSFAELSDGDALATLALNVTAVMRLTRAVLPGFRSRNAGTIVNVGSVLAFQAMAVTTLYSATKAFVLTLTQGLAQELADTGIHVQAVLPAGTITEFYEAAGLSIENFDRSIFMSAENLVDAALLGLDRKEVVTMPSLQDGALWETFEAARTQLFAGTQNGSPAPRYTQSA